MAKRIYGEKLYYLRNHVHQLSIEELVELVNSQLSKPSLFLTDKTYKRWEALQTKKNRQTTEAAFQLVARVLRTTPEELMIREESAPETHVISHYREFRGRKRARSSNKAPKVNKNSHIRLAIFDLDGTLFTNYTFSWKEIWRYLGYEDDLRKKYFRLQHAGSITYAQWCDVCVEHFRAKGLSKRDFQEITKSVQPVKNLIEGLKILKQSGLKLAIVSGGVFDFIEYLLPNYNDYFDHIFINRFCYDENGLLDSCEPTQFDFEGKKAAAIMLCEEYGLRRDQGAFTGDQSNDKSVANSGLRTIAFNAGEGETHDLFNYSVNNGDFFGVVKVILRDT